MTDAERRDALEQIATEVRACDRCRLHETRNRAVPGEGNAATEVLFVGEGPGQNEDREGRPFVGAAGSFLTELLGSVGWRRDEVFITNIVKCRPPGNRDPEPDEIAACAPFLERQMAALDPALVVTLGRHSLGRFMPGARIGQAHGTTRPIDPATGATDAMVFAMYHPAAALHQGSLRQTLLNDMQAVPVALLAARDRRDRLAGERTAPGSGSAGDIETADALDGAADLEREVASVIGFEALPEDSGSPAPATPAPAAALQTPGGIRAEPIAAPELTASANHESAAPSAPAPVAPDPARLAAAVRPATNSPATALPTASMTPLDADPSADQLTLF